MDTLSATSSRPRSTPAQLGAQRNFAIEDITALEAEVRTHAIEDA
jgi:hypothetical protein